MVYGAFTSNVDMRTGSPAFGTPEYVKGAIATRPDGPPLPAAVAVVERDGLERRRRPGRLRVRDGDLGRRHGRRQPAVPGRGLARGRPDGLVREAHRRCRDPPDDVRGAPADRRRRGGAGGRRDRRGRARAGTSSARPTRSSATRPRSTGRSLSDWRNFETWQEDGARTATERANRIWKQLLAEYEPPLFKVTERVYQLRGFDISNMTIVEGDSGADHHRSAAHRRDRARRRSSSITSIGRSKPVVAVIYTHSHVDHFGGVQGRGRRGRRRGGQGQGDRARPASWRHAVGREHAGRQRR